MKTKRCKRRIVVYDKGKELKLADNALFLHSLFDKEKCLLYYHNKIRVERNMITKSEIREAFGTPDTQLMNILNSNTNPILDLLNRTNHKYQRSPQVKR